MNWDEYISVHGQPAYADPTLDPFSDDLHMAVMELSGDNSYSGAVALMWRSIARGTASPNDVAAFAEAVAKRVSANLLDKKPTSPDRGLLALAAIGLAQRTDENYAARAVLRKFLASENFRILDNEEPNDIRSKAFKRLSRRKSMLQHMRSYGFYEEVNDRNASKRIDRLEAQIKEGR